MIILNKCIVVCRMHYEYQLIYYELTALLCEFNDMSKTPYSTKD